MNKLLFILLITISVLLSLDSCYYDKGDILNGNLCDTLNVSYSKQISEIITINCLSCHETGNTNGGINLDNYSDTKDAVINGNLLDRISRNANDPSLMPKGGPKLSPCNIRTFEIWSDIGAPEN